MTIHTDFEAFTSYFKKNVLVVLRPQPQRRFAVSICPSSAVKFMNIKQGSTEGFCYLRHHHVKQTLELSIRLAIKFQMHEYKTGQHIRILLPPPILAKPSLAWRTTCVIATVRGFMSSCHRHVKSTLELSIRIRNRFSNP